MAEYRVDSRIEAAYEYLRLAIRLTQIGEQEGAHDAVNNARALLDAVVEPQP